MVYQFVIYWILFFANWQKLRKYAEQNNTIYIIHVSMVIKTIQYKKILKIVILAKL